MARKISNLFSIFSLNFIEEKNVSVKRPTQSYAVNRIIDEMKTKSIVFNADILFLRFKYYIFLRKRNITVIYIVLYK